MEIESLFAERERTYVCVSVCVLLCTPVSGERITPVCCIGGRMFMHDHESTFVFLCIGDLFPSFFLVTDLYTACVHIFICPRF